MQLLIAFLEGVVTFVSPCLLPMLPVYLSYFAAGGEETPGRALRGAAGFVLGFTAVFTAMGALAGTVGAALHAHQRLLDAVCGGIVILFGLSFLGLLPTLFRGGVSRRPEGHGFWSCALFGAVFSVSWTPCVGVFLGSALMLASRQGQAVLGVLMLLAYSLGLGLPFLLSALLVAQLKGTFAWLRRHGELIGRLSGGLLILLGILMATGLLGRLLNWIGGAV